MTNEQKEWIDKQSYTGLLRKWRFEPTASGYFCDEDTFDYFKKRIDAKKELLTKGDQVAASKIVGWENMQ